MNEFNLKSFIWFNFKIFSLFAFNTKQITKIQAKVNLKEYDQINLYSKYHHHDSTSSFYFHVLFIHPNSREISRIFKFLQTFMVHDSNYIFFSRIEVNIPQEIPL